MNASSGSFACLRSAIALLLLSVSLPIAAAQQYTIQGTVLDPAGKPVSDAAVRLERSDVPGIIEAKTGAAGGFAFSALPAGSYALTAEKSGLRSRSTIVSTSPDGNLKQIDLVLEAASAASSSSPAMEFADQPNFTVAGVTDWTAVGGHGSDATLRTSEALARETIALQPPSASQTNASAHPDAAGRHRLQAELDEKMGDPLAAVHEDEQAVRLDPSEQNYFAWGSELLLHRAVWQAAEVFRNGSKAYPNSARMLAALGAALFAGALYDQAAGSLCQASDLNPADTQPYIFMGKIEMAAPQPLPCIEPRLARFVQQQPGNSLANYFYAMAIWKRQQQPADQKALQQVETLLTSAVAIDPKCADAYLQLGILSASRHDFAQAIAFYTRAIAVDPQLGEAHYRLGVAYDRIGSPEKAKQEFQLHDEMEKLQAAAVERRRRELKQFLVVLQGQPAAPPAR